MKRTHTSIPALVACVIVLVRLCVIQAHAEGGVPLWTNFYAGGNAIAVAVDNNGSVFVTGLLYSDVANPTGDYGTLAYSSNGDPLWTNYFNGAANRYDNGQAVAVDRNGNVFVTGESEATNGAWDYVTIGYSGAGMPLWTNAYNGPANANDFPLAIATDVNGNVFVTGDSEAAPAGYNSYDYLTVAYSGAGVPMWTNRYDGPAHLRDTAWAVKTDGDGNVFVVGTSAVNANNSAYVTLKYSSNGLPMWTNRYGYVFDNAINAITVDSDGNVLVTGSSDVGYATIKYSAAGVPLWTNRYSRPGFHYGMANAIAVDAHGNAFVTGGQSDPSGNSEFATIKYSSSGLPLWTNYYQPGSPSAIALDSAGNVFVAGTSGIVAYSNAGVPLWTNRYDYYQLVAIVVDCNDNVIGTGVFYDAATTANSYVTIKFSSSSPPRLDLHKLNNQLVLTWSDSSYSLQSAPSAAGVFTSVSGATSPYTNAITGSQQFFRLSQ